MFLNCGSVAISNVYPAFCGFGTSVQRSVTGKVTAAPFAGERSVGGGGNGALYDRTNVRTFDGWLEMPFAFTAVPRRYHVPCGMLSPRSRPQEVPVLLGSCTALSCVK